MQAHPGMGVGFSVERDWGSVLGFDGGSPWHGHSLPDAQALVLAGVLVHPHKGEPAGLRQQGGAVPLPRPIRQVAVLDHGDALGGVIACDQAVTCRKETEEVCKRSHGTASDKAATCSRSQDLLL